MAYRLVKQTNWFSQMLYAINFWNNYEISYLLMIVQRTVLPQKSSKENCQKNELYRPLGILSVKLNIVE